MAAQAQVSKTIHVTTAGTLSSLLTTQEKSTVTDLTVTGNIDARDVKCMRDEITVLNTLYISKVNILAYYGTNGTADWFLDNLANKMPIFSFSLGYSGNTKLKSIILPNSITSIGRCAFNQNTSLEFVSIPSQVNSIEQQAFFGSLH